MFTTARLSLSLGDHCYPRGVESWMDDQVTRTAQLYKTAGSKDTGVLEEEMGGLGWWCGWA